MENIILLLLSVLMNQLQAYVTAASRLLQNYKAVLNNIFFQIMASDLKIKLLQKQRKKRLKRLASKPRRWWTEPGRSKEWWSKIRFGISPDIIWSRNFRMTRPTFVKLCVKLEPFIKRDTTVFRSSMCRRFGMYYDVIKEQTKTSG